MTPKTLFFRSRPRPKTLWVRPMWRKSSREVIHLHKTIVQVGRTQVFTFCAAS